MSLESVHLNAFDKQKSIKRFTSQPNSAAAIFRESIFVYWQMIFIENKTTSLEMSSDANDECIADIIMHKNKRTGSRDNCHATAIQKYVIFKS